MFFILSEINYDFATQNAFAEDDGPHTGFNSFVSEQSLGPAMGNGGGGHGIIQVLHIIHLISLTGATEIFLCYSNLA